MVVTTDADAVLNRLRGEAESPRQDFAELARALGAQMLSFSDISRASAFARCLARCVGRPAALAWLAFRRGGSFYFVTAENAALPLLFLLKLRRGVTVALIAHRLTPPRKTRLVRWFGLFRHIGAVLCYSRQQAEHARSVLRVPAERVALIPFQVDEKFFTPAAEAGFGRGVVSVGRELRDYPTLFAALDGTDIPVTVVASSPWSRRADQTADRRLPDNVVLKKGINSVELRDLYRQAAVVVVPLQNVDWPAGVTSLFEGQACGRPVVVSASAGILDSIEPGAAATVPCGDPRALREEILRLIRDPAAAAELGRRGRAAVLQDKTLDLFVTRIAAACRAAEEPDDKGGSHETGCQT